jgi:hypothetical protein
MKPSKTHLLLCSAGLAVAMSISGCASNQSVPAKAIADVNARPCEQNFTQEGSALSLTGSSFSTHAFVSRVNRKMAIERAAKQIAMDGLQVATIDKEGGLLTAGNRVIAGNGESVPLVLTAEPAKDGVDLKLKFAIRFGQMTSANAIKDNFCKIIDAAARG